MNYLDELELAIVCAVLLWNYKLQSQVSKQQETLKDLINRIKSEFNHKVDYQEIKTKSKMDELQMKYDKMLLENKLEAQSLRNRWESIVLELNRMKAKETKGIKETKETKETKEQVDKKQNKQTIKDNFNRSVFNHLFNKFVPASQSTSTQKRKYTKLSICDKVNMTMQKKYGINLPTYKKENNQKYRKEYKKLYNKYHYNLSKKTKKSINKEKALF
jgi:hypothetical protein